MICGIDVGRSELKAYAGSKKAKCKSLVGDWRERRLLNEHPGNYEFEIDGMRYFTADLATESDSCRAMGTSGKVHMESKVLFLLGIGLLDIGERPYIVTGLPVEQHTREGKQAFINLVKGHYDIAINRQRRHLIIDPERLAIAPEGAGAYWDAILDDSGRLGDSVLAQQPVYIVDFGSRTINYLLIDRRQYRDRFSGTLPYGIGELDNMRRRSPGDGAEEQFTRRIIADLSWRWVDFDASKDVVLLTGGGSLLLERWLRQHYPLARMVADPVHANSRGYYKMGLLKWGAR